ncbi:MAG: radical SAM protein [Nitrospina sp.]|nr:MAG: radical SAM protein [Nitrospina sp.]
MPFEPEIIYLEPEAEAYPLAQRVLRSFPHTPVVRGRPMSEVVSEVRQTSADVFGAGKRQLVLSKFKGSFLKKCPGISPGMVCCNYYIVNLIKNCIYDCSYCFLQDFLENNPVLSAFVNVEDLIEELEEVFTAHPQRTFRVGTGELTDSLALEAMLPYSDTLIPFFNKQTNAVLELKTKSDCVENLLQQKDPTNIIISWSLNPEEIVAQEEKGTASVQQRLEAARRCQEKGYRVGFHFDPILLFPGWERAYEELIDLVFQKTIASKIEWVSLGSFRYRPNLKKIIKERHHDTRLFIAEHVAGEDGKFRYLRPLRNHAYQTIRALLKKRSEALNIYLCMETKEIWEGVTGQLPRADQKLDQFFDL